MSQEQTKSARERIADKQKKYATGGGFFKLEDDGDYAVIRFLHSDADDIDAHCLPAHVVEVDNKERKVACLQTADCPLCLAGNKPALKLCLYVVRVDEKNNSFGETPELWERGSTFIGKILGLIDEYGELINRNYKVVRNGKKGSTKTTYEFYAKDPDTDPEATYDELPERPELVGGFILNWSAEDMNEYLGISNKPAAPVNRGGGNQTGGRKGRLPF